MNKYRENTELNGLQGLAVFIDMFIAFTTRW